MPLLKARIPFITFVLEEPAKNFPFGMQFRGVSKSIVLKLVLFEATNSRVSVNIILLQIR